MTNESNFQATGDLSLLRYFGRGTRLWSSQGRHEVGEDWWLALSGEPSVNMNMACCWSEDPEVMIQQCLEPVLEARRPAIIMLTGPGLANASTLTDAGWVNVGMTPMLAMRARTREWNLDPSARRLHRDDLESARQLMVEVFGMDPAIARVAMPDAVSDGDDMEAWGLFDGPELLSSAIIVWEDPVATMWSLAVRRDRQRGGLGRRLMESVLHRVDEMGASGSVFTASGAGEQLYYSAGFQLNAELQLWSRPRWMLGVG